MNSIEIVPMTDINDAYASYIGEDLCHVIRDDEITRRLLYRRNFIGVVSRHYDLERSVESSRKARELSLAGELGAYALLDSETNRAIGMATVIPGQELWRQKIPLPPFFTRNTKLGQLIIEPGKNIANAAAWVSQDDENGGNLKDAYEYLTSEYTITWTAEPTSSPDYIHQAIIHAGFRLQPMKATHFDDGESRRNIPPKAHLYLHTHN